MFPEVAIANVFAKMDARKDDKDETSFMLRSIDRGAGKRQVKLSAAFWDEVEQIRSNRTSNDLSLLADDTEEDDPEFQADLSDNEDDESSSSGKEKE